MSRRDRIRMSADELAAFVAQQRTVICASNGRDGWPHLMPLWYVMRGDELWAWTYAKSQKVRNLERDPRASLQIEAGAELLTRYGDPSAPPEVTAATAHRPPSGWRCGSWCGAPPAGTTARRIDAPPARGRQPLVCARCHRSRV